MGLRSSGGELFGVISFEAQAAVFRGVKPSGDEVGNEGCDLFGEAVVGRTGEGVADLD